MADNYRKLWLQSNLNLIASNRALEHIMSTGRALPCRVVKVSGSIVTVAFEVTSDNQTLPQVQMPKAESQWIRVPTQVGDFGVTVPADTYLGGISGLGGGVAQLSQQQGNLSTLLFVPCASVNFSAVNINAAYIAGPQGAVIQSSGGGAILNVGTNSVTITVGSKTWMFTSAGFTMSDNIVAETHGHDYLPGTGSSTRTTGPVT